MSESPLPPETLRLTELGLLTAALVHELRQPIFAARALLQLALRDAGLATPQVDAALEQLATMERLIQGYSDFSRKPGDRVELFDVRGPIESALTVLGHRARNHGVVLDVALGPAQAVRASSLALQQAVVNLGQNAIDAVVGREERRVEIRCGEAGADVYVEVADTGPGVSDEVQARLFQPFTTTKAQGTGLGLWLTRELLGNCGGSLTLAAGGPGARWRILLPKARADG